MRCLHPPAAGTGAADPGSDLPGRMPLAARSPEQRYRRSRSRDRRGL